MKLFPDSPRSVYEFKLWVRDLSDKELHLEMAGQWKAEKDFEEEEFNIFINELERRANAK